MIVQWNMPPEPAPETLGFADWLRVGLRGVPTAVLVFGGLLLLLLVRLIEKPLFGLHRPLTPHITQFVCRNALRIMGIGFSTEGEVMTHSGAIVANHSSWLDIFVLNARKRVYFVSKSEVASWPGIGWLAKATGTVFINRSGKEAKLQQQVFEARLQAGHKLLFFPEGTSTDSLVVLPFKSSLFQAFFSKSLPSDMYIQPVTVRYQPREGQDPRLFGWWGDMDFGGHLVKMLARTGKGSVSVVYHTPLKVSDFPNRKALAARAEDIVRGGLEEAA